MLEEWNFTFRLDKTMFREFKKFISRGNVIELAVGLIMATYFGAIVKSLVNDIIMPPVGLLIDDVDFNDMKYVLKEAVPETFTGSGDAIPEVAVAYGAFISTIVTFFIVSLAVFAAARAYNKMSESIRKKGDVAPASPPAPTQEEILLTEIRDILKQNKA